MAGSVYPDEVDGRVGATMTPGAGAPVEVGGRPGWASFVACGSLAPVGPCATTRAVSKMKTIASNVYSPMKPSSENRPFPAETRCEVPTGVRIKPYTIQGCLPMRWKTRIVRSRVPHTPRSSPTIGLYIECWSKG